jgi:hypothetical protein
MKPTTESGRDVRVFGHSAAKAPALCQRLMDNTSKVHGDRESTAVCESTLIRTPAPRWPKRLWRTKAISTRPTTPQEKLRSHGQLGCRLNARRS